MYAQIELIQFLVTFEQSHELKNSVLVSQAVDGLNFITLHKTSVFIKVQTVDTI